MKHSNLTRSGLAVVFLGLLLPRAAEAQVTERASQAGSTEGNGSSREAAVSGDGRFVAFKSAATNLVAGDTNAAFDVFVLDRVTGVLERVSVATGGVEGNAASDSAPISADGRFVAFPSQATNLVAGDTNASQDIFVRDRTAGTTERVSVGPAAVEADFSSAAPSISADGRFVAFSSQATNLVAGDTNASQDIFVRDRTAGTTERVNVGPAAVEADSSAFFPSISADGRFVAFASFATNLVAGDTNGLNDIFVHDRTSGSTERVSVGPAAVEADGNSASSSISADGRFVAFSSNATNLVAGDTNGLNDIFVHDRASASTERSSVSSAGAQATGFSSIPSISADGRFVAFGSFATNLVAGDTNGTFDIIVRDRTAGTTVRVSVDSAGGEANGSSSVPRISADGSVVVFPSNASDLIAGDTNGTDDVFVATNSLAPTPVVNDGLSADVDQQSSTTSLSANWIDFPQGAFSTTAFEVALGTTDGGTEVQGFTSAGLVTSTTVSGLTLTPGETYFVTVRPVDSSGATGQEVSSDGVVVLLSSATGSGGGGGGGTTMIVKDDSDALCSILGAVRAQGASTGGWVLAALAALLGTAAVTVGRSRPRRLDRH